MALFEKEHFLFEMARRREATWKQSQVLRGKAGKRVRVGGGQCGSTQVHERSGKTANNIHAG